MSPDDLPVPNDDAVARAARHALGALSGADAFGDHSWSSVQTRARRLRQRRTSVVGATCAIVFVGAGAAVAMTNHDGGSRLRVAGPGSTLAPAASSTVATTTLPESYDSSSAPPLDTTSLGGTAGPTTTVLLPGAAPQVGDVTGTSALAGFYFGASGQREVPVGASASIQVHIRNASGRTIWASNSSFPTALALVCAPQSADPSRSLWWMTNVALAPGDADSRDASFTPTAAYVGTVQCELDVVAPAEGQVVNFDTSAGGDAAHALIVGRVTGVPAITFTVVAGQSSATSPGPMTTATTVP